jgi:hypothetical protein
MDLRGTGIRIRNRNKMESEKFSQTQYKIVNLISFIYLFFHTINLMKLKFFGGKLCFLWSRYGTGT